MGFAASNIPKISTHLLLLKSAAMIGVNFGRFTSQFSAKAKEINVFVNNLMVGDRSIWPLISQHIPMHAGAPAIASLPGRYAPGKIVLTLDG